MKPLKHIESNTVALPTVDIDTDQIIPARFLTTTTREGLGDNLFHDWRYTNDGKENPNFLLNQNHNKDCQILIAGNNFGCGSSREHAPWALMDYGFKAVISTKIADIFKSNSLKNGLLPIIVDEETLNELVRQSGEKITINVEKSEMTISNNKKISYEIDEFSKYCLVEGIDQLGYLQRHTIEIKKFEKMRTWTP
ncbi:MAG: 3-isopropylmalate dehydratase small subunit [Woeseiaceae bacterium]|jgi:3-isopropylmalate/(R)-2-methylmalate dehydratase small subunit|nr:3-isopropylmalate dehydratase small subunit [Woeseiaceae bacterium]|tara:strand:- start:1838 stop:2422 length:585 start_codon:yes stop_codon:yes gene_type:complete